MGKDKLEILIIAYAFYPDKTVGALRTSYWFSELPNAMECRTTVITANPQASGEREIVVPDSGRSSRLNPVKDSGLGWKKDILEFIQTGKLTPPDLVLISGSPFMHFSLAKDLKKIFGCKVVLDYRDPFANNANFAYSGLKVTVKRYFERKFNRFADGLITVNEFCGERIEGFKSKPHVFIQNGYDDRVQPILKDIDLDHPKLVYTGKFYFDPSELLYAALETKTDFAYAGPDKIEEKFRDILDHRGLIDYPAAVQLIGDSDIAVIQTVGDDSISTTKIFDYIRCQRIILIISKDKLEGKGITNELEGYPNVYWSANSRADIAKALDAIKSHEFVLPDKEFVEKFSRRKQMSKLVNFIEQLVK